jgi:hypothetical protein
VENKENIDQLFRDGLLEPDIPFNEQDWEKMSRKLDIQAKKKLFPVWLIWGSAVAAMLIISLFWMFLKPSITDQNHAKTQIARQQKPAGGRNTQNQEVQPNAQKQQSGDHKSINRSPNANRIIEGQPIYARKQAIQDTSNLQQLDMLNTEQIVLQPQSLATANLSVPFDTTINTAIARSTQPSDTYVAVVKDVQKKMKTAGRQNSGLVLSAMVAPDISYAKSSISSKVSSNAGLLATYAFTPKLSFTTGAIYSNKYYNSNVDGVNGYNTSGASYQINAACNVLDIPLNVNYKIVDKKAYSVSVNTGLSSYLMLKEKYDYIYPQAGSDANIVSIQVRNQNQHILGVANVAINVERKISSNLSIGVQPFMKLPLTGIGLGDARLKSSGMSFSLNMSLFPAKKPSRFASLNHY